ncbi:ABC transporter permease [Fusibacillus kribbianus]|uniref:ABC transporter permease n=1 Tax=Fusibacillus kribbianus TaxID=3044208 RepID=A0AAP4BAV4_9FIRM|nr:ABC transporter permease [Ruminococcus sp. YH-rum2234]MDI9242894.1 ABC transporter permease [Ruminococcus sp. YH-rum2234]
MGILLAIQGAVSQGVLWGIMALGIYLTYRILDVADLTVDGSFALGGCTCAALVTAGMNPWLSLVVAVAAGMIAGFVTGMLHTKCAIPAILAGILTQIGLYSINLRIMGRSNTPLLKTPTIFKSLASMTGLAQNWVSMIVGAIFVIVLIAVLYWFFGTEIGSAIRATGNNENMVRSLGMNTNTHKVMGLALSNGLVALSGALVTQSQGYADVKQGTGAIVIGLASIIIGEVIFGKKNSFGTKLASVVIGSIIYRIIVAVVLQMGLNTDDLKLLTALLVAAALTVPVILDKRRQAASYDPMTDKKDGKGGK